MSIPSPEEQIEAFLVQRREALRKAFRLTAEVENADERRKIIRSEDIAAIGGSTEKAMHLAQASQRYRDAARELGELRIQAADARAEAEYLEWRFDKWRTQMASARAKRM